MTTGRINQVVSVPFEIQCLNPKMVSAQAGFSKKPRPASLYTRRAFSVAPECGLPSAGIGPRHELSTLKSLLVPRSPLMRHSSFTVLSSQNQVFSRRVRMHKLDLDAFKRTLVVTTALVVCSPDSRPSRAEREERALPTPGEHWSITP